MDDCVKRLAEGGEAMSFEVWEKQQKEQMENEEKTRKKAKKEEEERKRSEWAARKQQSKKMKNSYDSLLDANDELTEKELLMFRRYKKPVIVGPQVISQGNRRKKRRGCWGNYNHNHHPKNNHKHNHNQSSLHQPSPYHPTNKSNPS